MKKNRFAVALMMSAIGFSAYCPSFAAKIVADLPRFSQVAEGIFRGGQPSLEGLRQLHDTGIKTVINLRNKPELSATEEQEVKDLGMNYVNIPLDGIHRPSKESIEQFLALTQNQAAKPLFVHCQYGVDRTGTLVAIYREEMEHWTANQAYKEMVEKGFHTQMAWMADTVFDWEEAKGTAVSQNRPLSVRLYDTLHDALSFTKASDKRTAR